MQEIHQRFAALSDPTRLTLVERLMSRGELPAGSLVEGTGISAPAISRHLKVLRDAGLVRQRVDGTRRIYAVQPEGLKAIADWAIERRKFWEQSLDRLETAILIEEEDNGRSAP